MYNLCFFFQLSIPKKLKGDVVNVFSLPAENFDSQSKTRSNLKIDYTLLAKGNMRETRFVISKIILDTIGCGPHVESDDITEESDDVIKMNNDITTVDKKRIIDSVTEQLRAKKRKPVEKDSVEKTDKEEGNNEAKKLLQDYHRKRVDGKILDKKKNVLPNSRTLKNKKNEVKGYSSLSSIFK